MKKETNKQGVLSYIKSLCEEQRKKGSDINGCDTNHLVEYFGLKRANISRYLNELYDEGSLIKIKGKPVMYCYNFNNKLLEGNKSFDNLIGGKGSLKKAVQQAKASILYPPRGLYTLLLGETGVGKTMFAELMHSFALESRVMPPSAPFIAFNCADYANNPQLLMAQLFGAKKGAYTGADKERIGVVEKADKGILFLDEVHRLPPEGQELLFYLMDKGEFYPLGESELAKKSNAMIICATTEDADRSLLATFTRRIPMNIVLPPLRDRSFEERYDLICQFLKVESHRIGREIHVSPNSLRALLLYNAAGNVGQLKSDIQLGCANAFLKSKTKREKNITLHSTDFSAAVKQGLLNYKYYKDKIDILVMGRRVLSFSSSKVEELWTLEQEKLQDNFYEEIEGRIQELELRGVEQEDINLLMSMEIEGYFNKFLVEGERHINRQELSKLVSKEIMDLVEEFLYFASSKLNRVFSNKAFYGLCLHISSTLERLRTGKGIINPNLKKIIEEYKEEYALSLNFASNLERFFNMKIPVDEVGFISMFLNLGRDKDFQDSSYPIVVVAMHGSHTALSMMEVAQKLVGAYNIYAYDMSLDKNPKDAYQELKELIIKQHRGEGVLLLVDMGSLKYFGELIEEETGIIIKVIELASTITVIECARKALIEKDINKIWNSVRESHLTFFKSAIKSLSENFKAKKDNIIITLCSTGVGSAIIIKEMIEKQLLKEESSLQIIPLNVSDAKEFLANLNILGKDKKILAIIGTFNPDIYGIPFISAEEIFSSRSRELLASLLPKSNRISYEQIIDNYCLEMDDAVNKATYKHICLSIIEFIEEELKLPLQEEIGTGLTLHLICTVKRLKEGRKSPSCELKNKMQKEYPREINELKLYINSLLKQEKIQINDDEVCFILRNVLELTS